MVNVTNSNAQKRRRTHGGLTRVQSGVYNEYNVCEDIAHPCEGLLHNGEE